MSSDDNNPVFIGGDQSFFSQCTESRFVMHSFTSSALDTDSDSTSNEAPCETVDKIIKKLNSDMAEMIFRFISGEEVMRTKDIANILSYLCWKDIMHARVSKKWREAAKQSIVPPTIFHIDSVRSYNAIRVMCTALPNMEQLSISNLGHENMYSIGKDPDE